MPAGFERCQKQGGRIRTISGPNKLFGLKKGEYQHICFLNGEMYKGETKTKEKK